MMQNQKIETFQDLVVWQKSHHLVRNLYQKTIKFPKKELGGIALQIRAASVLIPTNIAKGFKKRSRKIKIDNYRVALEGIEDLRYYILLANDLGLFKEASAAIEELDVIEKMLKRLIRSNISQRE